MQMLLEFFPLVAFFVAYKFFGGIYPATATLMVAMVLSLIALRIRSGRMPAIFGASTALVLLMGTATLILRSAQFIQWKPSIFLWLLALAFLASGFVGQQPLAQRLFQTTLPELQLERRDWLKLNFSWVVFGVLAGAGNLLVAFYTSEATWVKVKVFGLTGAMMVFVVAQVLWLQSRGKLNP
jgi:intracellular septation protein